jgi:hypothetical protein
MTTPPAPLPLPTHNRYFKSQCPDQKPDWIVITVHSDDPGDADKTEPITVPGARCPDGQRRPAWVKGTEAEYLTDQPPATA